MFWLNSLSTDSSSEPNETAAMLAASKQAAELGIYEIVRNIATKGNNTDNPCEAEWEGCKLVFNQKKVVNDLESKVTSITMSNGTLLYQAYDSALSVIAGLLVTDFRYGAWVERITKYSEQITAKKQQEAEAKAQEKLKPFSGIDF